LELVVIAAWIATICCIAIVALYETERQVEQFTIGSVTTPIGTLEVVVDYLKHCDFTVCTLVEEW
jgi:hypothetical protein